MAEILFVTALVAELAIAIGISLQRRVSLHRRIAPSYFPRDNVRVVDAIFGERCLARFYDDMDSDRSDLDAYVAMIDEFGARSLLDIGCGTGTLARLLASRGVEVVAVDPAGASLEVARRHECTSW